MRETDKHVFFWKGTDIYSNFYYKPFKHRGSVYRWSEQAIMYRKAMLFGAREVASKILEAKNPQECKKLGRSRKIPFREDIWEKHREEIFKEVLKDKFKVPELKEELLSTGKREFVEASPFDTIWGIGMGENDQGVEDKRNWKGENLLGKILTGVRNELRH